MGMKALSAVLSAVMEKVQLHEAVDQSDCVLTGEARMQLPSILDNSGSPHRALGVQTSLTAKSTKLPISCLLKPHAEAAAQRIATHFSSAGV